jgi:hypothetical protein
VRRGRGTAGVLGTPGRPRPRMRKADSRGGQETMSFARK